MRILVMMERPYFRRRGASGLTAAVFGVLAGIGGLVHGIGEVLQGSVATPGLVFDSWTTGPVATNMDGAPALSVVGNLLVTGMLTIIISLAVIAWSVLLTDRQRGGRGLTLLSVMLLLVGGGFAPPLIGVLAGTAGAGVRSPLTWWRETLPGRVRRALARLWPWAFAIGALAATMLVLGPLVVVYASGFNNSAFYTNLFFFVVISLLVTIVAALAYDAERLVRVSGGFIQPRDAETET